jgi:hypothetical protein
MNAFTCVRNPLLHILHAELLAREHRCLDITRVRQKVLRDLLVGGVAVSDVDEWE